MNGADLRTVLLVARKELLESLRDRRTLFVALILPVLVYPIVTLGLGPVISLQKRKLAETAQQVAVTGADAAAAKALVLVPTVPEGGGPPAPPALEVVASADPRADLVEGRIQLWVDVPEGFDEALAKQETAVVVARWDNSDDRSREAWGKWRAAVEAAGRREMDARLARMGLAEAWRNPIRLDHEDVAPPERNAAYVFGRILAMLLVLMTLTSSFYPAVDVVAGEKERGTMETLLVAPCGRTELVLGKFAAVLAVTLAAALLNLASLALTTGPLLSAMGPGRLPALQVTWPVVLGILALLVPLAALFSAVSLSLSTLARSVKEAQHYLSPLVMLVMPMAMVVILPNLPLTKTLAAVPVTSAVLFFRDLMLGRTEWGTGVIVMVSTFGFAALAIWASVLLFLREETLFRGPEGSGAAFQRPAPRTLPSAPAAVFLFAASLAALWYSQGAMPRGVAASVLVQQLAIVLAPCLLLAWWLRLDAGATFLVRRPSPAAWTSAALAVPLGLALPPVGAAIQRAVVGEVAPDAAFRAVAEVLGRWMEGSSALTLVALLAILPAVCEETVFRGFLLSGLTGGAPDRGRRIRAVVLSAVLFAVFHVYPEKWPNTFAVGLVFGWVALRTGSIFPSLVAHAVQNGCAVLAGKFGKGTWVEDVYGAAPAPGRDAWLAVAVAVAAATLVGVHLVTRRRAPGPAPDPAATDSARGT